MIWTVMGPSYSNRKRRVRSDFNQQSLKELILHGTSENREEGIVFRRKLFNFVKNDVKPYAIPNREKTYNYKSL